MATPMDKPRNRLREQQYVDRIKGYSRLLTLDSMYAGMHFERLASYLCPPYEARTQYNMPTNTEDGFACSQPFEFASIHDLNPDASWKVKHFRSPADFQREASELAANSPFEHVVFLRGHPNREWMRKVGSIYNMDPEFFRRHLDFLSDHQGYFDLPSLPSISSYGIEMSTFTIGNYSQKSGETPTLLRKLQQQTAKVMSRYRAQMRESRSNLGESVVRGCSIHDTRYFSVEQSVSARVVPTAKAWVAFIFLDHGADLGKVFKDKLRLPVLGSTVGSGCNQPIYLPIIQHRPGIALESREHLISPLSESERTQTDVPQTFSLLHLNYGRWLDSRVAGIDSFYALEELMCIAADNTNQLVNLLQSRLEQDLAHSTLVEQDNPSFSNILYQVDVIDRLKLSIQTTIATIESSRQSAWPRSDIVESDTRALNMLESITCTSVEDLLQKYRALAARCEHIARRCDRGTLIITHKAVIKESRDAIFEAKQVAKLTQLAFIFIPLSFTTSFFGMNDVQLGTGRLKILIWAAVSLPVLLASLLLAKLDLSGAVKRLKVCMSAKD